jgi:hypothetical protein
VIKTGKSQREEDKKSKEKRLKTIKKDGMEDKEKRMKEDNGEG